MDSISSVFGNFDWYYTNYLSFISRSLMEYVYLPILLIVGLITYRRLRWRKGVKIPFIVVGIVLAFYAPVIDVMLMGIDMRYYCKNEQGEHIYKTAKATSLYGNSINPDFYLESGFKFVERYSKGKLYRFELSGRELRKFSIDTLASEFVLVNEDLSLANNVDLINWRVENRTTGEILGETKKFRAGPGWLDRLTPSFGPILFWCSKPDDYKIDDFVLKVLIPQK